MIILLRVTTGYWADIVEIEVGAGVKTLYLNFRLFCSGTQIGIGDHLPTHQELPTSTCGCINGHLVSSFKVAARACSG